MKVMVTWRGSRGSDRFDTFEGPEVAWLVDENGTLSVMHAGGQALFNPRVWSKIEVQP